MNISTQHHAWYRTPNLILRPSDGVPRYDAYYDQAPKDDPLLVAQVFDDYCGILKSHPKALQYLRRRGLHDADLIDTFQLGFANRSLGLRLPTKDTVDGEAARGQLQRVGILKGSGHELFCGSLIFPIFDEQGSIVDAYGRKISTELRAGTPRHLTLADEPRGLFNREALERSRRIIITKSPLEAATFWCAGHRNVIGMLGLRGFSDEHLEAFSKVGTERVYIAFDNSAAGNRAACLVAQALAVLGIECRRVIFPVGMDANAFARKANSPAEAFADRIRAATLFQQSYEQIQEDSR